MMASDSPQNSLMIGIKKMGQDFLPHYGVGFANLPSSLIKFSNIM